ncbi:MAG TPA: hypothetical protein DEV93_08895 [Chloroflexi bacterium]|nr:hypothetical protein [Chloroflexota bacterium]
MRLKVTTGGRAEEGEGSSIGIARHDRGEDDVLNASQRPHVNRFGPRRAMIVCNGDPSMAVRTLISEVDRAVSRYSDRGVIADGSSAVGDLMNSPSCAVVGGDSYALLAAATAGRDVHRPIGSHFHMSVDAGAGRQVVDRHSGTEGQAAIVTASAKRRRDVLGAVIHRVLEAGQRSRRWDREAA